jgi:RNA polymerase sigma factor (sigma-70 family)
VPDSAAVDRLGMSTSQPTCRTNPQSVRSARSYSGVMRHLDRLPDDALLAAVALDERDAAAVFVRRFQRRVYGLAVTMTHDATLADDIAQITFERAWRHAGSYDVRRGSVATWLLTITRNLAIDSMRVRRAIPFDADLLDRLLPASSGVDPQQAAVESDQLGRLGVELAGLPVDQRRAVLLATLAGRTAVEIAEIEGVPLGTAKTRIRTGLRRLRAAVTEVSP